MVSLAAALALALFVSPAWAVTPTDAVRQVFDQTDKILTDPETEDRPLERFLAVRKLVNEAFDVRSAAVLASGDHWRARTLAEQEEFTWLFGDLLERAFVSRLASKANLDGGTKIRYLGESIDGGTALVQTGIGRRDGGEMLVDYRLIERDGSWKVRDVAIDGVSVMANYRAQLDRVLGSSSFPELLTQMRAKVGAVEPPTPPVSRVDVAPPVETKPTEEVSLPVQTVSTVEPAVTPPRALTTRAYWLQISTVETAEEAGRLVSRLREGKFPVTFERTQANGKPKVSIRVGPFQDVAEAVSELLDLQTKGHDPFLFAERE